MARAAAWPILAAESGISHYFEEIRRFPMLDRQEEYLLAKHWREDGDSGEWQDWLVDESPDQETMLAASEEFDNRRKTLSDALTVLNKRERRIFETRRLAEEQITLVELAEEFGVSRERVRQIEVGAFAKVQNAVKHRVAAMATPAPLQVR